MLFVFGKNAVRFLLKNRSFHFFERWSFWLINRSRDEIHYLSGYETETHLKS